MNVSIIFISTLVSYHNRRTPTSTTWRSDHSKPPLIHQHHSFTPTSRPNMVSVFYPKKAKVELRNRRRRKEKLLKSGTDGNIGVVASKHDETHLKVHDGNGNDVTMTKNASGGSSSGRKRTADQMSNIIPSSSTTRKAEKVATAMTTIVIFTNKRSPNPTHHTPKVTRQTSQTKINQ